MLDCGSLLEELAAKFGSQVQVNTEAKDMPTVAVDPGALLDLMKELKPKFPLLADLTGADYQGELEVIYHLMAIPSADQLRVKVRVPAEGAELPSLVSVWSAAEVQEREVYDLLGIKFAGHPHLTRILCPDDFSGHALRKDFQLARAERS